MTNFRHDFLKITTNSLYDDSFRPHTHTKNSHKFFSSSLGVQGSIHGESKQSQSRKAIIRMLGEFIAKHTKDQNKKLLRRLTFSLLCHSAYDFH